MSKFFSVLLFSISLILPFSALLADDTGAETIPSAIAQEEQTASAHNYGQTLCKNPLYTCEKVMRKETWNSLFPNFQERENMMRLNRTNVALEYKNWIVVPKNLQMPYMAMSPLPAHMNTRGRKLVLIDLGLFAFGAYDKAGKLLYWGPVSSGRKKCWGDRTKGNCATIAGAFAVFRIEGKNCISHEFPLETHGGDPMPYCMYFHGGTAMHYSTLSGFINRSDGCVRMFKLDAKWLNKEFVKLGTEVIVKK